MSFLKSIFDLEVDIKRRKREWALISLLFFLFFLLITLQFYLLNESKEFPFEYSLVFLGLVNFNIFIFLTLCFLIFKNLFKVFGDRTYLFGASLKKKLITAFIAFSFVPVLIIFLVSIFYINNSFNQWFDNKVSGALQEAVSFETHYYSFVKKAQYRFARSFFGKINGPASLAIDLNKKQNIDNLINRVDDSFAVDRVDIISSKNFKSLFSSNASHFDYINEIKNKSASVTEWSQIIEVGAQQHIRVFVRGYYGGEPVIVAVSYIVPMGFLSSLKIVRSAAHLLGQDNFLFFSSKSIYFLILILLTLTILFSATWFGFYLAKRLTVPIEVLSQASHEIALGRYPQLHKESLSQEFEQLLNDFNYMTNELKKSKNAAQDADKKLKLALSRLDENYQYVQFILENVETSILVVDENEKLIRVNQLFLQAFELKFKKVKGKFLQQLLEKDSLEVFRSILKQMKTQNKKTFQKEDIFYLKQQAFTYDIKVSVLETQARQTAGYIFTLYDLTQSIQTQKMEAWSEVARRMAHEIKNPLTPISLSAQRLQKKFSHLVSDKSFDDFIKMIIDQTQSLKSLVNEFSMYSRLPPVQYGLNDLNVVVGEALVLFRTSHLEIDFEFKKSNKVLSFFFDRAQIKRVLTNLISNSIDAVSETQSPKIHIHTSLQKDIVNLSVSDNGKGISFEIRKKIFEPYVSYKKTGTGLGLVVARKIVLEHGGDIKVASNSPQGAQFIIRLPYNRDFDKENHREQAEN